MKTRFTKKIAMILTAALLLTACAPALAAGGSSQKLNTYYSLAICSEETDPEISADLHLKKGCVYTIRKEYEDALKELDEALRIAPDLAEAYLVKVQVYTETGNNAEAIPNLEKYVELTGDASLNESLAQMYLAAEDREKAVESYRNLAESTSDDPEVVAYNLAMFLMGAEMYPEALETLKQCKADPEKAPGLHYNTGVCNMLLGNFEDAIANFTDSLAAENYQMDATYNRGVCNMTLTNFREAIDDFTAYIDGMDAAAAEPRTEMQTEEAAGTENAEDAAEQAEASNTDETAAADTAAVDIAHYYRGICYISVEEYENAAADFTVCIDHGLNVNESTFNRGLSYLQGGKFEEAKADFTACIDQEYMTDDALFYRSYAFRYLEDNDAALADLTVCVEHEYNLGQTYQQRAQIYQAMGETDLYLQDLEASLEFLED